MADSTRTRVEGDTVGETESRSAAGGDKHVHHGRTTAAWTGSLIAMLATIMGGIGVMMQNWVLFWVAVAVMVVGLILVKVLQVLGHGAR
ncbi:HGxxPAAW family protein [uncultured Friedmanniella sp.]|uniref:HGxxPAAW family protein n=1 Tax=uncultured Friedmanniella sp. TaxID=335381 RepID=UPI0035CC5D70